VSVAFVNCEETTTPTEIKWPPATLFIWPSANLRTLLLDAAVTLNLEGKVDTVVLFSTAG
jgi:hypothetical protein